ncbi:MAG: ribosome-associated translation inhibitor RaiA [Deltaproteobacteria bacterium]|nr:ribosome-associated translation inhibitor RaiA [Deltaproteobacteria bacterium]
MKISVTFRNTEGDDWHKEYVDDRLKRLNKYIDAPVDARVVLSVEKFRNVAEVNLMANGLSVNAKEEEKDMYLAIDSAVEKIERQLKKHKEKSRGHKNSAARGDVAAVSLPPEEETEDPASIIVETRKMVLKPMSLDDALMEMETSKNRFLLFLDSATEYVSVIYRRDDGKYGLIETQKRM